MTGLPLNSAEKIDISTLDHNGITRSDTDDTRQADRSQFGEGIQNPDHSNGPCPPQKRQRQQQQNRGKPQSKLSPPHCTLVLHHPEIQPHPIGNLHFYIRFNKGVFHVGSRKLQKVNQVVIQFRKSLFHIRCNRLRCPVTGESLHYQPNKNRSKRKE